MPDAYGPLQHLELAPALWLVPAAPLLGFFFCLALLLRKKSPAALRLGPRVAIVALIAAWAIALGYGTRLVRLPAPDRYLFCHLWRVIRLGQLDAGLDFALDSLSGVMVLVVLAVATASLIAEIQRRSTRVLAASAWHMLGTAGALLAVTSDNLVVFVVGASLTYAGLRALALTEDDSSRSLADGLYSRAADAAAIAAVAVLFWGAGGVWSEGEYVPDLTPRFAAVVAGTQPPGRAGPSYLRDDDDDDDDERRPATPTGKGLVTLTSYPGAVVFVDDARLPLMKPGPAHEPLRAPFVGVPIDAGHHSFRIHPGSGLDDYLVTHVAISAGQEVHLAAFGATVVARQARDPMLARGGHGFSPPLGLKRIWGARVVAWATALLLLAVALRTSIAPFGGLASRGARSRALTLSPLGLAIATYLFARFGFVTALSTNASLVLAVTGAVSALAASALACASADDDRRLSLLAVAHTGFALVCAGSRTFDALVLYACVAPLALAALAIARHGRDPRGARVAGLALVALPVVSGAIEAPLREGAISAIVASVLAGVTLCAAFLAAFAGVRTSLDLQRARLTRPRTPASLFAAGVASAILGVGGTLVRVRPMLLDNWLGGVFAPAALRPGLSVVTQWGALALGVAVVLGAASFARTRARHERGPLPIPFVSGARALVEGDVPSSAATGLVLRVQHVVTGLERWVLGPALSLLAVATHLAARGQRATEDSLERSTLGAVASRIERASSAIPEGRGQLAAFVLLFVALSIGVVFAVMAR